MSENNLINRKNKSQLIEDLMNENFKRRTCSFYKYVRIKDPQSMRKNLLHSQLVDFLRLYNLSELQYYSGHFHTNYIELFLH